MDELTGFLLTGEIPESESNLPIPIEPNSASVSLDSSSPDRPLGDAPNQAFSSSGTESSPTTSNNLPSPSGGDQVLGSIVDSVLIEPTPIGDSTQDDESDLIQIDDAPAILVPQIPAPIVPKPITISINPAVDPGDTINSGLIEGPMPELPVLVQADPITGTPFDELIEQLLRSLNPVNPVKPVTPANLTNPVVAPPSYQASNATATIADEVVSPPSAAASAIASADSTNSSDSANTCAGLSELDELTLQLHDGFELRSGNNGKGAVQLLTNYGNDSDDRTFIRVTDRRDPFSTSYTAYFEGEVQFGETFTVRAEAGGAEAFRSKVYLHYFDEENHNILRTVQYSASCDAPVQVNDKLGGATLIGFSSSAD